MLITSLISVVFAVREQQRPGSQEVPALPGAAYQVSTMALDAKQARRFQVLGLVNRDPFELTCHLSMMLD